MNQPEMLLINSVKKVKNTNQRLFNGQTADTQVQYFYVLNVVKDTDLTRNGKKVITAAGNTKVVFANSNLHRTLFTELDVICKDLPEGANAATAESKPVEIYAYGYTVNYVPKGKKIVRTIDNGKGGKEDREFANVTLVVLGERAYVKDGEFIPATGETPESIYKGMLRKELFREVDDTTGDSYDTAEEDMLKKATEDQINNQTPPTNP